MRSLDTVLLLAIGSLLASLNLWFAAKRSTIPLAPDDRAEKVEMRSEKHLGKDDVYLITFESGKVLQVDELVANAVWQADHLEKRAWERMLTADSRAIELRWSLDFRGMVVAKPVIVFLLFATAVGVVINIKP